MSSTGELLQKLQEGGGDEALRGLYALDGSDASLEKGRERAVRVVRAFEAEFGARPQAALFSGPGRTEIGGNHTDHQHGRVLCGSVDLDMLACAAPNGTDLVRIRSEGYPALEVDLRDLKVREEEKNSSPALVRGVAARLVELGCRPAGFDAYVTSTVLSGSGLSSSAAYEILVATIVDCFFGGGTLDPVERAKVGQYAENVYFGKPSGLLDQTASSVGGFTAIDFKDPENILIEKVNFDVTAHGYALCVVDTGGNHADLTNEYALVPKEMKEVAAFFGKEFLRDVDEQEFYDKIGEVRKQTGDRAVLRAFHIYADNDRVAKQVAALREGDFDTFLRLVNESGHSSWEYLQNVIPAGYKEHQEVAVTIAAAKHFLGGKGAVRVHGGGFAGTVQAFVPVELLAGFKANMEAILGEGRCHVLSIRPEGGAVL